MRATPPYWGVIIDTNRTYRNLDAFQLSDGRVMVVLGEPGHRVPEEYVLAEGTKMLRRCPKCKKDGGLVYCPVCHGVKRNPSECDYLIDALETIGTKCQNYVGATTCVTANRIRGAEYSADAWCEQCIAREALSKVS